LAPYDQGVQRSISPPSTQGSLAQPVAVVEQTHELVQGIMQLGNRSRLPIELYDSEGQFIARYKPEYRRVHEALIYRFFMLFDHLHA
jgi:hypothetical protein